MPTWDLHVCFVGKINARRHSQYHLFLMQMFSRMPKVRLERCHAAIIVSFKSPERKERGERTSYGPP